VIFFPPVTRRNRLTADDADRADRADRQTINLMNAPTLGALRAVACHAVALAEADCRIRWVRIKWLFQSVTTDRSDTVRRAAAL
jgi:hypothetical protein